MPLFNPRQSSDNSFKESVLMVSKLVKWAKELGWETVGIADSSNYHGFLQFGKAASKEGLKPVLGIILKVSLGADVGEFLVIAKNEKGLGFVRNAVSKAFTAEADNRVVPYQSLVGSKDVFVLSGGMNSFVGQAWSWKSEATEAKLRQTETLAALVQNHKTPSAVARKVLDEDELEIAKSRGLKGETLRAYLLETLAGRKRHLHQSMLAAKNSSEERAEAALAKFAKDFGSDFFVEIVRGYSGELKKENDKYNAFAIGLAKKLGVGLAASVPTFYATPSKKRAWLVNKANDIGLTVGELGKLDSGDFHMRSPEDFAKTFADVPEALDGNSKIAEKCSWTVGKYEYQTPVVKIDDPEILAKYREYSDRWARDGFEPLPLNAFYVRYYCSRNLWKKYEIDFDENETYFMVSVDKKERKTSKELQAMEEENLIDYAATLWPERKRRIVESKNQRVQSVVRRFDYEFLVIEAMGFVDYFVIVADFINWAKWQGIPVGPGRGSAPGSMLAYLMDITDVEPMKYGLLFTRFLNINRISYPDIDTDFADRDPLVEYCRQKYGADHVAQVCTFGTMGAKWALKDVFRVYQVPHYRSQELSNMIGKTQTLSEAYDENPTFRSEIEADPIIKEAFEAARDLEGVKRQIGIHACAVVITPKPVSEYCVVQAQGGDKGEAPKIVTQLEGLDAESIGLIKMDFLGISSLAVIGWAVADVERMEGKKIDLLKIDLEDKAVLSSIYSKADTDGVFQFESPGMKKYLKELAPDAFDDVVAMVALYRPGPMDYIGGQEADPATGKEFKPSYIKRKNGTEKIEYVDPDLKNSLQNTQGLCVFQESLMQMVRDYAGFSMGEADILRKAVGKKKRELVDEQKVVFMEKSGKRGKDPKVAEKIWKDVVEPFAGYGFNKSHAVTYSVVSFQTAYLKHYYRAAFMANLLTVMAKEGQPEDKTVYIRNAIETGIAVLPPDVNASETRYFPVDRKTVRCGFIGIKGLGHGGDAIVNERKERGPFKSVVDFVKRMGKKLSKSDYVALARCWALDGFGNEREDLVASAQEEYFAYDPEKGTLPKVISVKKSDDWMAERYVNETALLGEYLSPHPISGFKSSFRTSFVGAEGFYKKQNGRFRCFGIVTSKLEKTSKNGTKFGIVSVETADFAFEALAFNEAWRNSKAHVDAFRVVKVSWEVKFEGEDGRRAVFLKDIESYPMTQFFDAMKDDRSDSEKEKVDRTSLLLDFSGKRNAKFIKIKASEKDRLKDVASKLAELPFGYDLPVFEIENSDGSKTTYPYPKTVDITPLLKKKEEEGKEGS